MNLKENALTSSIPKSMGDMTSLAVVDLSFNFLTGTIPFVQKDFLFLELGYNMLTGNLPEEMGNWTNIIYLSMRNNNLSGTV